MPELDEFSFLSDQAASLGRPVPAVERVRLTLSDGRSLSGLRWGDAPPQVTLLHGAGLNAHTWDTTVLHLAAPTLALDLPGHGDSSWRDDAAYIAHTLAPDVVAAVEAWAGGPQTLVGHSLGGLTAAAVAASRPDLVSELVIIDITPGVDPSAGPAQIRAFFAGPTDWASRDELVDRAVAFGLGGSRDAAARGVFLNSRVRPDGRVEWKHHFAHLAAAAANADAAPTTPDAVRAVLTATGWDDLAGVTHPITLVRAERGFVTSADADEFARRAPGARLLTLPTGHNAQEEDPAALAALLRKTLPSGSSDAAD